MELGPRVSQDRAVLASHAERMVCTAMLHGGHRAHEGTAVSVITGAPWAATGDLK